MRRASKPASAFSAASSGNASQAILMLKIDTGSLTRHRVCFRGCAPASSDSTQTFWLVPPRRPCLDRCSTPDPGTPVMGPCPAQSPLVSRACLHTQPEHRPPAAMSTAKACHASLCTPGWTQGLPQLSSGCRCRLLPAVGCCVAHLTQSWYKLRVFSALAQTITWGCSRGRCSLSANR